MVSPLDPGLANIFMYGFQNKRLNDCHHGLKPVFQRQCFDDLFALSPLSTIQKSLKGIYHPNIPRLNFGKGEKIMVVYLFWTSIFFVKMEYVLLMFTKKDL